MLKKIDSAESGKSRRAFEDIIGSLKDSNPEAATALEKEVLKNVKTFTVGKEIQTGGLSGSLQGTARSIFGGTANLAGLAARKTGLAATANLAKNFTSAVLDSKPVQDSIMKAPATIVTGAKDKAPHDLQRQVAKAAENAEPEFLNSQADQIRQKYGNQGEQLAVILNNMANKDKNARRALMFTVLQNTVYRKMLGLQEE